MAAATDIPSPSWLDYGIFVLTLCLSAAVGLYYTIVGVKRKEKQSNAEYLLGNRQLPVWPTAISVLATSSISLIGIPAEVYTRGINIWIYTLVGGVSMLINALVFLPVFYRFRPTCIHDYFAARFQSYSLRTFVSMTFCISTLFSMSVIMYAPAVSLARLMRLPDWIFILSTGIVCTFYTTLGGLKAVVWSDALQTVVMFVGILALAIKGTMDAGGWNRVWQVAEDYGRIEPARNLDPTIFQYFSLWAAMFSAIPFWLSMYGVSQVAVQRYCSVPTLRQARQVVAISTPLYLIVQSIPCFIGLVMLAYFYDCDPIRAKLSRKDELVIYFVMKVFGAIPGLPGLFLACLCCGTLGAVASAINSMVAVVWETLLPQMCFGNRDRNSLGSFGNKLMALALGSVCTGMAFACGSLGGVMKAAQTFIGGFSGPLTGLFALGVLVPSANGRGALLGGLISVAVIMWLVAGNMIYGTYDSVFMVTSTAGCGNSNETLPLMVGDPFQNVSAYGNSYYGKTNVFLMYRISEWYYPIIGFVLVMFFGTVGSWIIPCKPQVPPEKKSMKQKESEVLVHTPESLTLWAVLRERKQPKVCDSVSATCTVKTIQVDTAI